MNKKRVQMAELYPVIQRQLSRNGSVTFTVSGRSMQPMLYNRRDSVTLVSAPQRLKKYDVIFYKRDNGRFILHRIIRVHKDGLFTCRGDNQWEKEYPVRPDQVIGVVSSFNRSGREIGVRSFKYRIYVYTWPLLHHFKPLYHLFFKPVQKSEK